MEDIVFWLITFLFYNLAMVAYPLSCFLSNNDSLKQSYRVTFHLQLVLSMLSWLQLAFYVEKKGSFQLMGLLIPFLIGVIFLVVNLLVFVASFFRGKE